MHFLTSPRLLFRCWSTSDLPLAISLWGDPEVTRYLGGAMSPEAVQARLQTEMDRQRNFGVQYWPVFLQVDGEFAGCAGLRPFHEEPGVFELGVHIVRRYWGERLGEEAARAVIRYAFEDIGVVALTAGHNPENLNSKALIERLGMVFTHCEPWGRLGIEHRFYRMDRP
ncbi:MAG: GNAT family N-acetyltransferase [Acidobacteriaceae bacterium]